ncbi:DNA-directed RNA polymerase III subunit RPC7 [Blastomyces silverae]|uniref:DNA-directed RNA polymerase III subunit n=1 Tax=Blastomyces silverae TaxID=2060906 RepID=A0A0H1BHE3_9EURO|nr:DNA-directed RNA polymerase III subunit RPC7 [Blastomyces silverae]
MSRFGANRGKKLPGAEFSWDTEGGGEPDNAPTPLFPKYSAPIAKSLTEEERSQVDYYRRLREMIHDGPYYTVLSAPPSSQKGGAAAARKAQFDPFQGMATYGQRYLKKTRTLPKLSGRPYVMNFFPKELWSTLDPKYVGLQAGGANGFGSLLRGGQKRGFEDEEEDEDVGPSRKKAAADGEEDEEGSEVGEKRKRRAGGEDEDLLDEDEDGGEEEIVDDDFEDDEEDMGGDYNAEQYFDGGDEDGDGYDGGGDGDNDTY